MGLGFCAQKNIITKRLLWTAEDRPNRINYCGGCSGSWLHPPCATHAVMASSGGNLFDDR